VQVNAIYDHGKLELPESIHLKHQRFQMIVDVPDDEIDQKVSVSGNEQGIRTRINQILGEYAQLFPADSSLDAKKEWHKHLEEKYVK